MATATATDSTEIITAALHELFKRLREIVDRGPTDDPALVDEIGKLNGRIRSKITRARKRDQVATKATSPGVPTPGAPTTTSGAAGSRSAARPVVSAATPAAPAGGPRTTVKVPAPGAPATSNSSAARPLAQPRKAAASTIRRATFAFSRTARAALVGPAIGGGFVFSIDSLVDREVPVIWIWVCSILALVAFVGGICVWANSAAKRWGQTVFPTTPPVTARKRTAPSRRRRRGNA